MPSGPSKRRISRPLNSLNSWSVKKPPGHVADVQLEQRVVVRRRREREAAPPAVLQQEVDVLAGEELQPLVGGQLELDDRDVGGGASRSTRSRHGRRLIWMSPARRTSCTSMTRSVCGFAQQKSARPLRLFVVGERRRLVRAVVDLAGEDPALAGAAGAVAAAVRQHEVGAHRGRQHGVAVVAGERVVAGLYGNLARHGCRMSCGRRGERVAPRQAEWTDGVIRVLLIGCGDVALRTADLLRGRARLYGLTRRPDDVPRLRAHGIVPIVGDLDRLATLDRLRAAPFAVLHFAPPPSEGRDDPRTRKLIAALARARSIPQRFVYISTSGVYGDCAGARVDETRVRAARRRRARGVASRPRTGCATGRRATASRCRSCARPASTPRRGCRSTGSSTARRCSCPTTTCSPTTSTPTISRARRSPRCSAAQPNRAYNVTDDAEMKMGGWFDARRRRVPPAAPAARDVGGGRAADRADAAVVHERVAPPRPTRG